jgi:hypothetical protein
MLSLTNRRPSRPRFDLESRTNDDLDMHSLDAKFCRCLKRLRQPAGSIGMPRSFFACECNVTQYDSGIFHTCAERLPQAAQRDHCHVTNKVALAALQQMQCRARAIRRRPRASAGGGELSRRVARAAVGISIFRKKPARGLAQHLTVEICPLPLRERA